jgi:4-alpha-glucanotransferase
MGDIPILISPDSADVWLNPQFFNLNLRAGAPPDMYNEEGQNWGFPLYNWEAMQNDNYSWWRARLRHASDYYHLYRIDHIVGFFRIWAVPEGEKATKGTFIPLDQNNWLPHGKAVMEMMLESSSMLPIGEDLGTVPPEVRTCLRELGICGTKVMRWERYWEQGRTFIPMEAYLPMSLTTVSTHDSTSLTQWWKESSEEVLEYCKAKNWTYAPQITHEQLLAILADSHKSGSLFHINLLNEYLALFPEMVHSDPAFERINLPGTIQDSNWSYRMIPSVEEITSHKGLKELLKTLSSHQP